MPEDATPKRNMAPSALALEVACGLMISRKANPCAIIVSDFLHGAIFLEIMVRVLLSAGFGAAVAGCAEQSELQERYRGWFAWHLQRRLDQSV